ncbi:bifunctional 4-hydroxy-2-oxoglutarate aldolase/2-dehydro-3-deoxy-phosphogluconate aldolase [Virgibacillus litoralis]|uniref:2-dehydro-3-deoxyphosphogluconate aldolase/(4S)-4-hydroxy-2-oxoglutarate aldolase n=1 Tax=Virgibacillus litoralis TaxID=578221 RepID=A0ABS4HFY0_9BACI|nr:bifunctional 4-hydroxy-2-oxoglutarate aldolase/2-dehydro-3-deoxy-phosphogluconate aldolase [Virgibacillus litoralis]MBP1949773.1 2-dehydro-3-deoxyphosphogluconate aldolase/(4S)-4-hydroxy-2-oxoglutarate aldolase [Virgibacillus litoralis]
MDKWEQLQFLKESGLVAVLRKLDKDKINKICKALIKGGTGAIEITVDSDGSFEMINRLKIEHGDQVLIGAGTVLDAETAKTAIQAGADFIFSPIFNKEVIQLTNKYGKISIPGAMTPTEIVEANQAGADLIKVFPANALSINYIKDLQGPLGHISMMPTGGVSLDNVEHFIRTGSVAVGVGGSLTDAEAIADGNFEKLTEIAEQFVMLIKRARV